MALEAPGAASARLAPILLSAVLVLAGLSVVHLSASPPIGSGALSIDARAGTSPVAFPLARSPAATNLCPNSYFYGVGTQLNLSDTVDCAGYAGFSGDLEITFVSMSYQESGFCPGAIESGSGTCSDTSPGCGSSDPDAEGILQEGTSGQCPPSGGSFPVGSYSASSCSTWSGSSSDWGGIYFNPQCSFQWAIAYYDVNGFAFWGSYLSGAYCQWAPVGFPGMGSELCDANDGYPSGGENLASLPWSTVCPNDNCTSSGSSPVTASYAMYDNTTAASLSCGGTFAAGNQIEFTATASGGTGKYTYAWSFGDNTTGTGNPVTHVYSSAGTVNPLLTVTDSNNSKGSTGSGCDFTVTGSIPTLSSISLSPSTVQMNTGGSAKFTATPTCSATCPSGITYAWSLTRTLGNLSATTGVSVTFTAGSTPGSLGIFVNATLNAITKQGSASITIAASTPALTSVAISPTSAAVMTGAKFGFNATPTCSATCPAGITYLWSLANTLGTLSNSTGPSVTFIAGNTAGTVHLFVNATLNAVTKQGSAAITITSTSSLAITSFTVSPTSVAVGSQVTFTGTVAGGTTPYAYTYGGLPPGCASLDTSAITCTPNTPGNYTVTLTVRDAANATATASTSVSVVGTSKGLAISAFTISPPKIPLGGVTYLNVTATGGTGPGSYTFTYHDLPPGCSSANVSSLPCAPSASGNYSGIMATVTDAVQVSVTSLSLSLSVTPFSSSVPVISSFSAGPASIPVNGTTYFNVSAWGGTGPLSYVYLGLPPACSTSNVTALSCSPDVPGNFSVTVVVTDARDHQASASTLLTVLAPAGYPTVSLSASPASLEVGGTTHITSGVGGGVTPYKYAYAGLPSGCASSNASAISCTPTATGRFSLRVMVTDAATHTVEAGTVLTVLAKPSPQPLEIVSFVASYNPVPEGDTTFLNVSATGGLPAYTYAYSNLPNGCSSSNTSSLVCTPTAAGNFTVTVQVTDSAGTSQTASVLLHVTQPGPGPGPLCGACSPTDLFYIGVALVAIIAIAGVAFLARKRAPPRAPPLPPYDPSQASWGPPPP